MFRLELFATPRFGGGAGRNGDTIKFTVEAMDQKIVHTGTVSGDEISIKVDFGGQAMEMTAKRM